MDEEGKPIERKKSRKKHIFDDSQRQLAEDIFGVAFDYEVEMFNVIYLFKKNIFYLTFIFLIIIQLSTLILLVIKG